MIPRERATLIGFGSCRLDLAARLLFREGREVHLSPKAFELLKLLIERRPEALAKSQLLERVWPETHVSDSSLARVVAEIRRAIGDDARGASHLRTVHGFGYAFAAPVVEIPASDAGAIAPRRRCWIVHASREIGLNEGENTIGRDVDAAIRLDSPRVSRRHARIMVCGSEGILEDLGSKNGTYLRGCRITRPLRLEHGDQIEVGSFRLTFRVTPATGSTETVGDDG
jgi:DNA-binding winged helix-turn-helix (wHTH) protein